MRFYFYILLLFLLNQAVFSQDDLKLIAIDTVETTMNPLAPAKAAFYSALLPGLGQAYNKKYWKIPIIYGAIGTGVYSYIWNKQKYNGYRDAYKQRLLLGDKSTDQFNNKSGVTLTPEKLIAAQKFHQRNKDLSLLVTTLLYILNIVDANVDGHLQQFNVNGKLTVRPEIRQSEFFNKQDVGLTLNYQF